MKIYVLKDPVTNEIRYVGVTGLTLVLRLSLHICTAKNCGWIKILSNLYSNIQQSENDGSELTPQSE